MEKTTELRQFFDSLYEFLEEKELEFGLEAPLTRKDSFTEAELMEALNLSRATLYRARRAGKLPFEYHSNGFIVYPYSAVLLAIKTNKFKVKGLNKLSALERLKEFKSLLEL